MAAILNESALASLLDEGGNDIYDETGPTGYVIGDHGRAVIMTSMVAQP